MAERGCDGSAEEMGEEVWATGWLQLGYSLDNPLLIKPSILNTTAFEEGNSETIYKSGCMLETSF